MNDYALTRNIRSDPRLADISVLMRSLLSSEANRVTGKSVGVDALPGQTRSHLLADILLA